MTTRYAVVVGETALLSNDWHFTGAGMELSSRTAEVALFSLMGLGST